MLPQHNLLVEFKGPLFFHLSGLTVTLKMWTFKSDHTCSNGVKESVLAAKEERRWNKELGRRAQDKGDEYKSLHMNYIIHNRWWGGSKDRPQWYSASSCCMDRDIAGSRLPPCVFQIDLVDEAQHTEMTHLTTYVALYWWKVQRLSLLRCFAVFLSTHTRHGPFPSPSTIHSHFTEQTDVTRRVWVHDTRSDMLQFPEVSLDEYSRSIQKHVTITFFQSSIIIFQSHSTNRCRVMVSNPASYMGSPELKKSWPGGRLSWGFSCFTSISRGEYWETALHQIHSTSYPIPRKLAQAEMLLTCSREMPSSNLGRDNNYLYSLSWVFPVSREHTVI